MTVLRPEARAGHIVEVVRARFGAAKFCGLRGGIGEDEVTIGRERLIALLSFLRDDRDLGLSQLFDLTAIDRLGLGGCRFVIVYRLKSPRLGYRARLLVELEENDLVVPSVHGLFPTADWLERELWDLFGVYPDGHPHLRRLLLYPQFVGHPLQRDYPAQKPQPLVPLRAIMEPVVVGVHGESREDRP
ncbi:MAG: NADH-quinone oxidoreductase subunit C [Myxococcota bacterium]